MSSALENEYVDILAKDIQKEIDEGIMSTILISSGWTSVEFYFENRYHSIDVVNWLSENCSRNFLRLGNCYLFENKKDAEWFILRWT